jgi:hypothetical protein
VVVVNLDAGTDNVSFSRVDGRFYNTLNLGTEKGDVWASVNIGDRGIGLEAWWQVFESLDDAGDTWEEKGTGTLTVPGLTEGNPYTTKIEYDGTNGFTFTVAGVSAPFTGPARQGAEFQSYKGLETGAYGSSGKGYTSALFDNVYINNQATVYDDFSTAPLDQTKWEHLEFVREIENGKLRLIANSDGDRETSRIEFVGINPYTEATVTVKSESWINSAAKGRTRIDGFFYNDTYGPGSYNGYEGNVWAQVYIDYYDDGTLEAKCYAERVMDADNTSWQELFFQSFPMSIMVDRPYTLSIHFTGTKLIFTCKDTVTGGKVFTEYQITTPANEPYNNFRSLLSRVYGEGSSGYMAVEFDDVYVDIAQPLFTDIPPGFWAAEHIYKIYYAGITSGCSQNPLMYCPEDPVTRAQMAVFLVRGIHGSDFIPPPASGIFGDVPVDHWAADWIEQFYNDGITSGCRQSPPLYCPENLVTRAEMAVFLLRSKHGSDYTPPAATGIFDDVPVDYWAADWIEQFYNDGITSGCSQNPLLYCPDSSVTRAQMAAFIARTFKPT